MFQNYREQKPTNGEAPKKLVVLLHGVGSNSDDMIELVHYFQPEMPDAHFISPNGIEPYDLAPYGYQWFSVQDRSLSGLQKELSRTHLVLKQSVKDHLMSLNLGYKDLILIGFSQGVMAALYLAIANKLDLGCIVGFGGSFIPPAYSFESIPMLPICLIHGEKDEVLPLDYMDKSAKILRGSGANVETHIIPNLGHSIDYTGIQNAIAFIKKHCYN